MRYVRCLLAFVLLCCSCNEGPLVDEEADPISPNTAYEEPLFQPTDQQKRASESLRVQLQHLEAKWTTFKTRKRYQPPDRYLRDAKALDAKFADARRELASLLHAGLLGRQPAEKDLEKAIAEIRTELARIEKEHPIGES